MTTKEICPVSEVIGEDHYFIAGTGKIVQWDIMGDSRAEVEVCLSCAELKDVCTHDWYYMGEPYAETMKCSYCGDTQR